MANTEMKLVAASGVKEKERTEKELEYRHHEGRDTSLPDSKTYLQNLILLIIILKINFVQDVSVYLSEKLDNRNFSDGFSFIWIKWTQKPNIQVKGWGWLFKMFLWCLR